MYVCQNNGWAISQPAETYLPAPVVARAAGYGIPGMAVDGNDVEAVRDAVNEAVTRARRGEGPTLIEARTWRIRGHWAGDKESYRESMDTELREDPIERFGTRLIERGAATPAVLNQIRTEVEAEVTTAVERAKAAPDAGPAELGLEEVYA